MTSPIQHRYDFVLLFDVSHGNPNGDPDAGNMPRFDPETGRGLVTDVCIKRKLRNFVSLIKQYQPPYNIYVREQAVLNELHDQAYEALGIDTSGTKAGKRKGKGDDITRARDHMCQHYFDVRTFGAVMSTGTNCGQVRGPVQLSFAQSIDPVTPSEHTVTRCAVTTSADAEKQSGDNRTMGRKYTIPYGLYRMHGFISAPLAAQTGFSQEDLALLWIGLSQMFEHDRSAARGEMATRGLYVFEHDSHLGNAPAHQLFDRISVEHVRPELPPRAFTDYRVSVQDADMPEGVTLHRPMEDGSLIRAA